MRPSQRKNRCCSAPACRAYCRALFEQCRAPACCKWHFARSAFGFDSAEPTERQSGLATKMEVGATSGIGIGHTGIAILSDCVTYGHRYSVRLCENGNLPIRRRQSELGSGWAFNSTAFDSGRLLCLFGLNSVVKPFHKQGWQSQMLWNNLST